VTGEQRSGSPNEAIPAENKNRVPVYPNVAEMAAMARASASMARAIRDFRREWPDERAEELLAEWSRRGSDAA
jgi:hypothetical protein